MLQDEAAQQEATGSRSGFRWVVLGAYMCVGAVTQLMWLTYAPVTSDVQRLLGVGEFRVVLLATVFPIMYLVFSLPAGILVDRRGFRAAVLVGAVLTAGFSYVRMFDSSYLLVLVGMCGIAAGQPFVLNSVTKLVATWFPGDESALANGLASLSLFVGMIAALALSPLLLDSFGRRSAGSLRGLALVYSFVATAALAVFAVLGKAKPAVPPRRAEHDIGAGTPTIDLSAIDRLGRISDFRLLGVAMFIAMGAFVALLQLLEKILQPKGIGSSGAGSIGALMVVAGVIGCVVLPALSDRLRRRRPFIVVAMGVAVPGFVLLGVLRPAALVTAVGIVLGFFLFSALPIGLTFSEEITGPALTGTATSVLLLLGNAGGVVLTLVMEQMRAATGGYAWPMALVAALFVVALVAALRLKETPLARPA